MSAIKCSTSFSYWHCLRARIQNQGDAFPESPEVFLVQSSIRTIWAYVFSGIWELIVIEVIFGQRIVGDFKSILHR